MVPMTPAIESVLTRAKAATKVESVYVISTKHGKPYDASGLRTSWRRACIRSGNEGLILKDLRPKAITDAHQAGYERKQLAIGAAHADEQMTERYMRIRETRLAR